MFRVSTGLRMAVGLLVLEVCATGVGAAPAANPVAIPSGRIRYTVSMRGVNGTQTLAWADHGRRYRQDVAMKINVPGKPAKTVNTWTFTDGAHLHSGDTATKQAVRVKLASGAKQSLGGVQTAGKVVGKASILGKPCEVRQQQGMKVWLWKGLPLRFEVKGGMKMVATRVEEGVNLPATLFQVPAGYNVREIQQQRPGGGPQPR